MCTVLLLLRPGERWPLLLGSNRDERLDRAFDPPARWWPQLPRVVGGRDRTGGGSWLAVNDDGVVATIVNGMDRLGPLAGKRSRGELVLRAVAERTAAAAANAIAALDAERYRGFTLVVADRERAFAVVNDERAIRAHALAPGHHMVTPDGCDRAGSPRFEAHFPAFRASAAPEPSRDDWAEWIALLRHADEDDPHRAITVVTDRAFGTVSSTLLALPAEHDAPPIVLFANGPPTEAPYEPIVAPWDRRPHVEGASR
ncbi:MAG TPA: NRDE family protein [Candidatus Baltobacteraceae bacterium]|nr:NRDE family protein [Candidatus Baltobacteraceae bacterium]